MALVSPDMWLPLGMFDVVVNDMFKNSNSGLADRTNPGLVVAGRLRAGITPQAAAPRLDALSRQLERAYPAENHDQLLTINPLPRMSTSTSPQTDTGLGAAAGLLMGLAGVVLFIACLNIANMLLARGVRTPEGNCDSAGGGWRAQPHRQAAADGGSPARICGRRGWSPARLLDHRSAGRLARERDAAGDPVRSSTGRGDHGRHDRICDPRDDGLRDRTGAEDVARRSRDGPQGIDDGSYAGARPAVQRPQHPGRRTDCAVADAAHGRRPVCARRVAGGVGQSRVQLSAGAPGVDRSKPRAIRRGSRPEHLQDGARAAYVGCPA